MGSGAILTEVAKAAQLLVAQGVNVTVYSVTSWSELARDGRACQHRQMAGDASAPMPFIAQQLQASSGPIIAATDYAVSYTHLFWPERRTEEAGAGHDGRTNRSP